MKKTRNTIIFIIISIIILYPLTHGFEFIKNTPLQLSLFNQSQVSNFKKYKNDYITIANFIIDYKEQLNKNESIYIDDYKGIKIYKSDNDDEIKTNKEKTELPGYL